MTIKDIAKMAGVSISTVSKIVNGKDEHINEQTRSRVLQLVKEYNYSPYAAVRNSSDTRHFLIGVLLRSASFSSMLISGILEMAQEKGYSILLQESHGDMGLELRHIAAFCKNKVDGIIWEPAGDQFSEHAGELEKQNIPYLVVNQLSRPDSYQPDYIQMGDILTEQLISRGHVSVFCLLRRDDLRSGLFLRGFKKCLYRHQITFSEDMAVFSNEQAIQKIVYQNYTGAVSAYLDLALSYFNELRQRQYIIPLDFSLLTLRDDSVEYADYCPISFIQIPFKEIGRRICSDLISLCENGEEGDNERVIPFSGKLYHERTCSAPLSLKQKRFVVVGSIHIDNTFNVDHLPQPGKTVLIRHTTVSMGGKGANQAIGAARLGKEVSLIGGIGNDSDAALIIRELEKADVSTQALSRHRDCQTGKAYIYTEKDGESAITILPGSNQLLAPEDIQNCSFLFQDASFCLLSSEVPADTIVEAARIAKEHRVTTVLKPSLIEEMPEELYQLIDIFIPNRKEAALLCSGKTTEAERAEYFYSRGIPTVIITLGHDGCCLKTKNTLKFFPADQTVSPVDTTGGADAFIAALCTYLSEGYSMEQAIQIATIAAGFCVTRQGVLPALIDRKGLETHIARFCPELLS